MDLPEKRNLEKEREDLLKTMKEIIPPEVLRDLDYITSLPTFSEPYFDVLVSSDGTVDANP
ncbi:MAG: hypothetical protein WBD99_03905 [Thermodesulfobacteriota bacterium]